MKNANSEQSLRSFEHLIQDQISNTRALIDDNVREAEAFVRRDPTKAILWAVGAGYLLRMLPVTAIINAFVRALLAMIRPAALLFGVAKVWDALQAAPQKSARP